MSADRHAAVLTWRVDVVVNDAAREVWGAAFTLTLHKRAGESRDHIVLKLIGALLIADGRGVVVIEPPVRVVGHRPDVVRERDGVIAAWVECGDVGVDKLDRVTRALGATVPVLALKKGRRGASELRRQLASIARPERVTTIGFDADAIDAIGEALNRRTHSRVVATIVSEDGDVRIDVAVDDVAVVLVGERFSVA